MTQLQVESACPLFSTRARAKSGRTVKTTVKHFKPREISADSAYLSYENMDLVDSIGATPYIAFKCNTTAEAGGTLAKMFHLFNLNRDQYLNHYHKRSNAESTFSMVKAKFGDSLRSKTDVALTNEALAKILCHNICCLIQSACELGVATTFWDDEPEATEPAPVETDTDQLMASFEWM